MKSPAPCLQARRIDQAGTVVANECVAPRTYVLGVELPEPTPVGPGQFAMLGSPHGPGAGHSPWDPLLRRPFSYYHSAEGGRTVDFLVRIYGEGTHLLAELEPGDTMTVLGPLGQPFPLPDNGSEAVVVAGGVGLAPFPLLAQDIHAHQADASIRLFFGAPTADEVFGLNEFRDTGVSVTVVTEDGTEGTKGMVTAVLAGLETTVRPAPTVYACGPPGLLKAVAAWAGEHDVPCYLSLEARMACGVGSCMGCTITTRAGNRLACRDGPVLAAGEVVW